MVSNLGDLRPVFLYISSDPRAGLGASLGSHVPSASLTLYCCLVPTDSIPRDEDHAVLPIVIYLGHGRQGP